jgi:hypothetical protein
MKRKVTLQFTSLLHLWSFANSIHTELLEINSTTRTLTCELLESEIQSAQEKYQAKVVSEAISSQ